MELNNYFLIERFIGQSNDWKEEYEYELDTHKYRARIEVEDNKVVNQALNIKQSVINMITELDNIKVSDKIIYNDRNYKVEYVSRLETNNRFHHLEVTAYEIE